MQPDRQILYRKDHSVAKYIICIARHNSVIYLLQWHRKAKQHRQINKTDKHTKPQQQQLAATFQGMSLLSEGCKAEGRQASPFPFASAYMGRSFLSVGRFGYVGRSHEMYFGGL